LNPIYSEGFVTLCPNFIQDLKNMNAVDNKIYTIKYNDKFEGVFIIGDDLTKYDSIKFPENKYHTNYFHSELSFKYDNIFMKDKLNKSFYLNIAGDQKKNTDAVIKINSGFIIGTEDFRNFIHIIFFEPLVKKNICSLNLLKLNHNDKIFGNEFYLYSCYYSKFVINNDNINYYEQFPRFVMNSKSYEYNFELTSKDLFEQIYDKYYFLIIFPKNFPDNKKYTWYLGEPFYKRYPFTINTDAKTIGFYFQKEEDKKSNNTKGIIDNKTKIINEDDKKIKNILIRIAEVIIGIGMLFGAYYIGIKVKEQRKKRANELKDDNYEYISEDSKDINDIENESKNKKFVELNSKLGV
jgi:hypothetical protein